MYNDLTFEKQEIIYNYGLKKGYDVNNPDVLDELAIQYFDLINVNLVNEVPPVYLSGAKITTSSLVSKTQNEIIDLMYADTKKNLQEYQENLVKVSSNSKASPLCVHAQGQVYWVYENDPKYERLDDHTYQGGGSSDQLFHPNCRHNMSVYFPGYSDEPLGTGNVNSANNDYQIDQNEKYINRNAKKWYDKKERARLTNDPKYEYYNKKHKEWVSRR